MDSKEDKKKYIKSLEKQWDIEPSSKESKQSIAKSKPDVPESELVKFKANEIKRLSKLVLSKTKQNKFISAYSEYPNVAKCAKAVGVSVTAIYRAMERDPEFKAAIMECRANIGESMKSAMVLVGTIPDARGANDRHRWLQAYDPAFKKTPEVQVNTQINMESDGSIKSILSRIMPNDD